MVYLVYRTPFEFYNKRDKGHYHIQVDKDIEGTAFETLEEW